MSSDVIKAALIAVLMTGCASTQNVVPPEDIAEVPVYKPLPVSCSAAVTVDLPAGSSANDVMAAQKKALEKAASQINRCFKP